LRCASAAAPALQQGPLMACSRAAPLSCCQAVTAAGWTSDSRAACAALAIPLPPRGVPQARRGAHKRLHSMRRVKRGLHGYELRREQAPNWRLCPVAASCSRRGAGSVRCVSLKGAGCVLVAVLSRQGRGTGAAGCVLDQHGPPWRQREARARAAACTGHQTSRS